MAERSSALDPSAEVFQQSDRLLNFKSVNSIYVPDKGSILERGNYDQLMRQDGEYRQQFEAEAHHYR